ncbi:potassium-transporting ATPase subunit KdpC [Paenibacillus oenotherae]|uniref:Potassium-transporting ATPase KdpC subunit n=1 Tax=Paenibacillus oenotherae TaxID=1435645 RepID=A0ABS7D5V0_9BACL|nr:potassium-transporting ATPase subunit KdpC [Paenibacillus oenotherae]MBW7475260.1 potassium-transporting ATPase subunit KdpC [Paenibacillus oenotherae]
MSTMVHEGQETRPRGAILWIALRAGVLFTVLCGIIYPLVSTGLAQTLFPDQANGSLLKDKEGNVIGSELIGQSFSGDPSYFHGRVSSIDYKGEASGSNNYAPSNSALISRVQASIAQWQQDNPDVPIQELPIALITNSGSGLDPHITPQSALVQIARISKLTGISAVELESLVSEFTESRDLGVFGEKRVNVLKLNLVLKEKLEK